MSDITLTYLCRDEYDGAIVLTTPCKDRAEFLALPLTSYYAGIKCVKGGWSSTECVAFYYDVGANSVFSQEVRHDAT